MIEWISPWHRQTHWLFITQQFEDIDELFDGFDALLIHAYLEAIDPVLETVVQLFDLPDKTKFTKKTPRIFRLNITLNPKIKPQMHKFHTNHSETEDGKLTLDKQTMDEPIRLVDIFQYADHLQIIAELPGVMKKDIHIHVTGTKLILTIQTHPCAKGPYTKIIHLPTEINTTQASSTYKNGVLQIILPKLDSDQRENHSISIK